MCIGLVWCHNMDVGGEWAKKASIYAIGWKECVISPLLRSLEEISLLKTKRTTTGLRQQYFYLSNWMVDWEFLLDRVVTSRHWLPISSANWIEMGTASLRRNPPLSGKCIIWCISTQISLLISTSYQKREDVGAIVHGHPTSAIAFALSHTLFRTDLFRYLQSILGNVEKCDYSICGGEELVFELCFWRSIILCDRQRIALQSFQRTKTFRSFYCILMELLLLERPFKRPFWNMNW